MKDQIVVRRFLDPPRGYPERIETFRQVMDLLHLLIFPAILRDTSMTPISGPLLVSDVPVPVLLRERKKLLVPVQNTMSLPLTFIICIPTLVKVSINLRNHVRDGVALPRSLQ